MRKQRFAGTVCLTSSWLRHAPKATHTEYCTVGQWHREHATGIRSAGSHDARGTRLASPTLTLLPASLSRTLVPGAKSLRAAVMPGKGAFACAKHAVIMWPCVGTKMSAPVRPCALSAATLMWQSNA